MFSCFSQIHENTLRAKLEGEGETSMCEVANLRQAIAALVSCQAEVVARLAIERRPESREKLKVLYEGLQIASDYFKGAVST